MPAVRSGAVLKINLPEVSIVTLVQPLQLLFSFNSVMIPASPDELLSAQALIEYVPSEVKVYEGEVAVLLVSAPKAAIGVGARSVLAPPPFAALDTWKKLLKPSPVEASPMLMIFDVNVTLVDVLAIVDGALAIRSEN